MKLASPIAIRRSRIEIIPLIDIMFFLLASFMMVSLQMDQTQNVKVRLPAASQARPGFQPDALNIAVDQAGVVWLARRAITLTELASVVSNRFQANQGVPVYISGDRATRQGRMARVLQVVRAAGPQRVAFLVDGGEEQGGR